MRGESLMIATVTTQFIIATALVIAALAVISIPRLHTWGNNLAEADRLRAHTEEMDLGQRRPVHVPLGEADLAPVVSGASFPLVVKRHHGELSVQVDDRNFVPLAEVFANSAAAGVMQTAMTVASSSIGVDWSAVVTVEAGGLKVAPLMTASLPRTFGRPA